VEDFEYRVSQDHEHARRSAVCLRHTQVHRHFCQKKFTNQLAWSQMEEARRENEAKIEQRRAAGYARQQQRTLGPPVDHNQRYVPAEQTAAVIQRDSLSATAAHRSRAPPPAPAVKAAAREPREVSTLKSNVVAEPTSTQVVSFVFVSFFIYKKVKTPRCWVQNDAGSMWTSLRHDETHSKSAGKRMGQSPAHAAERTRLWGWADPTTTAAPARPPTLAPSRAVAELDNDMERKVHAAARKVHMAREALAIKRNEQARKQAEAEKYLAQYAAAMGTGNRIATGPNASLLPRR
jgi:hypothetical protein